MAERPIILFPEPQLADQDKRRKNPIVKIKNGSLKSLEKVSKRQYVCMRKHT